MSTSIPIPKFTSFKPKGVGGDTGNNLNSVDEPRRGSPERKHHHQSHRSRSKERRQRHADEERLPVQIATDDGTSALFIEDRRGDIQNLVYGSIHRYSIPAFHRIGAGSVLGAKLDLKIERNFTEDKGIILNFQDERKRGREKYAFADNEKKPARLVRIRPDGKQEGAEAANVDFIPFRNLRPQKRKRLGNDENSASDEERQHYRSIEGKAKAVTEPLEEDPEWTSDSRSSDLEAGRTVRFDEALKRENIRLSRKVNENPDDIEAWIALINHQESLLGLADGGRRKITSAERISMADIKLHMYEKALAKAGSTLANRERLLLGLMAEGAKIWDFKTQSERWEQVSRGNLESALLWKQYVDFRQCTFVAFHYEEVRAIYVKRIKILKEALSKGENLKMDKGVLFEHLIYTILRVTLFMRESGYSELAIGIWQALLEFNFLSPDSSHLSSSRLDNFREFWDSEVLRIGEDGAKGWKNFNVDTEAPDPKFDEEVPRKYLETKGLFDGWVAAEKLRAAASRLPARTLDETVEDDPYRVILWSDIEDFLVDFSLGFVNSDVSHLLIDAFLIFCRLPPVPSLHSHTSRQWWIDSFARGELLDCSLKWIHNRFVNGLRQDKSASVVSSIFETDAKRGPDSFANPFHCFAGSCDTLFPSEHWANYLGQWRDPYADSETDTSQDTGNSHLHPFKIPTRLEGPIPYGWLRNALKNVVEATRRDVFTEYYLAFEFCNEPGDIKKVAKSLLKQNPRSLRLYNAYAMIERSRGNKEASANVIMAALGMRASLPENEKQVSILLWKTWVWSYLDGGDKDGALRCLFSIAEGTLSNSLNLSSPAVLLKTRQYLSSSRDFLISSGNNYYAAIYAELLALLEYLVSNTRNMASSQDQGEIESALAVFNSFSEDLIARGKGLDISTELLLQSAARLLCHHVRSGPFRPALLRDHLAKSLTLFPHNTIFLSIYSWNESRLRIDDRVRAILQSVVFTEANDNIISRLFSIRYEMCAGNVHSTLAAFENAVSSPACGSNPGLWRLYVLFCGYSKEFRHRAKEIFFRAMRLCPWAKEYLMTAFTEVEELGTDDKIAVYKVLMEKELRVHVDVEHRIEKWREEGKRRLDARR